VVSPIEWGKVEEVLHVRAPPVRSNATVTLSVGGAGETARPSRRHPSHHREEHGLSHKSPRSVRPHAALPLPRDLATAAPSDHRHTHPFGPMPGGRAGHLTVRERRIPTCSD
jgi:hypothetical protein